MRWLLVASVVAAAGISALSAAAAQPPDPCVLITTTDASTVLGATPPKAKPKTVGTARVCTYTVKKKTMTVQTTHVATQAAFDKAAKTTGIVVPVQAVGADAWSANGTTLLVWKNGTEITFTFVGVAPFVATQQSLAKTASDAFRERAPQRVLVDPRERLVPGEPLGGVNLGRVRRELARGDDVEAEVEVVVLVPGHPVDVDVEQARAGRADGEPGLLARLAQGRRRPPTRRPARSARRAGTTSRSCGGARAASARPPRRRRPPRR